MGRKIRWTKKVLVIGLVKWSKKDQGGHSWGSEGGLVGGDEDDMGEHAQRLSKKSPPKQQTSKLPKMSPPTETGKM